METVKYYMFWPSALKDFFFSWTSIFLPKKKTDGAVHPLGYSLMAVTSLLCGRSLTELHNPFIVTVTLDLPTMRPTSQWRSSKPQVIMVPTVSLTTDTMSMSKSCNENLFVKKSFHLNSLLLASQHFILFNLLHWNQSLSFYAGVLSKRVFLLRFAEDICLVLVDDLPYL